MPSRIRELSARLSEVTAQAGGATLLSFPVFLAGLASATILRVLGTPVSPRLPLADQLADGLISYLALWGWLLIVTRWLLRRHPQRVILIAISVLLGSGLRGALLHLLITRSQQEPIELLGYRILSSILLVGLAILISSYTLHQVRAQAAKFEQLDSYQATLAKALAESNRQLDSWFAGMVGRVQSTLRDALAGLDAGQPQRVSAEFKEIVAASIRPLSAELSWGGNTQP